MVDESLLRSDRMTKIREAIIDWYTANGRGFPWRETSDPYHVLVAEMLLRRTTATAVLRIFSPFILRFESIAELAKARPSAIEKQIESLGLQKVRARHLSQIARTIAQEYNGIIPSSIDALSRLPGVGRYLTAAIANFAFGVSVPMVDGNIVHFLNRIFNTELKGAEDERAWMIMQQLGNPKHERALYWGIIDLVATTCIRNSPRCTLCSLTELCRYSKAHSLR